MPPGPRKNSRTHNAWAQLCHDCTAAVGRGGRAAGPHSSAGDPDPFTPFRPYLAHFFPENSRFLRVFTAWPRRFQRAQSRNPGPTNSVKGAQTPFCRRGSGYYIDVGAVQLLVDGKVKLRSGKGLEIKRFEKNGVELNDGTKLDADLVVLATGYGSVRLAHSPSLPRPCHSCAYMMTCLLYTSPSPRDLSTSRMPSSA